MSNARGLDYSYGEEIINFSGMPRYVNIKLCSFGNSMYSLLFSLGNINFTIPCLGMYIHISVFAILNVFKMSWNLGVIII